MDKCELEEDCRKHFIGFGLDIPDRCPLCTRHVKDAIAMLNQLDKKDGLISVPGDKSPIGRGDEDGRLEAIPVFQRPDVGNRWDTCRNIINTVFRRIKNVLDRKTME